MTGGSTQLNQASASESGGGTGLTPTARCLIAYAETRKVGAGAAEECAAVSLAAIGQGFRARCSPLRHCASAKSHRQSVFVAPRGGRPVHVHQRVHRLGTLCAPPVRFVRMGTAADRRARSSPCQPVLWLHWHHRDLLAALEGGARNTLVSKANAVKVTASRPLAAGVATLRRSGRPPSSGSEPPSITRPVPRQRSVPRRHRRAAALMRRSVRSANCRRIDRDHS